MAAEMYILVILLALEAALLLDHLLVETSKRPRNVDADLHSSQHISSPNILIDN